MIELQLLDSSTATLDGVTITGPGHFYGASVTVGEATFGRGLISVASGSGTQVLSVTHGETEILPFALCIVFFLGLIFGCIAIPTKQ